MYLLDVYIYIYIEIFADFLSSAASRRLEPAPASGDGKILLAGADVGVTGRVVDVCGR